MKDKVREWSCARRRFSLLWDDFTEKHHLKSVDVQSENFKESDEKQMLTTSILKEIIAVAVEVGKSLHMYTYLFNIFNIG